MKKKTLPLVLLLLVTVSISAVAEGDRLYCVARDVTQLRESARQLEQTQEALVQSQKIEAMEFEAGGLPKPEDETAPASRSVESRTGQLKLRVVDED